MSAPTSYILGIDLGTTSVKACLLDKSTRKVAEYASRDHSAALRSDVPGGSEQDAQRIFSVIHILVSAMPRDKMELVREIAICGQMHGVVFWRDPANSHVVQNPAAAEENTGNAHHGIQRKGSMSLRAGQNNGGAQAQAEANGGLPWQQSRLGRFEVSSGVSRLHTWQDQRCTPAFISQLPTPDSHLRIATGFGCVTVFWYLRNKPEFLQCFDYAGTVQDLFVSMLCNRLKPSMSTHNAASWGYYNVEQRVWNTEILEKAGYPLKFLPEVVEPGSIAGYLHASWNSIPAGTPVYAALGDLQCSLHSCFKEPTDAVLNLSTSAQLAFLVNALPNTTKFDEYAERGIEFFAFRERTYLAVAASLNGGNVLASFVKMLQQWAHELGLGVPEAKIWERLTQLSLSTNTNSNVPSSNHNSQSQSANNSTGSQKDSSPSKAVEEMVVLPLLFGERHLPNSRAEVRNIAIENLQLGVVYRSICRGLARNLHSMMSDEVLRENSIHRILGSGTALLKNKVLQEELVRLYEDGSAKGNADGQAVKPLVVEFTENSEAAIGVALFIKDFARADA